MIRLRHPTAFTLIEVLLALTLAGLLLTAASALTRQVLMAEQATHRRQTEVNRTQVVLDTMARDVEHILLDATDTPIELPRATNIVLRLTTLAGVHTDDATRRPTHPVRVTYRLEAAPPPEPRETDPPAEVGYTLVRVQEDLTRPRGQRSTTRQTIARGLASVHVRIHDGGTWHDTWPPTREQDVPKVIEIQLTWPDRSPVRRRFLLGLIHA